jgi:hypothetical protein
MVAGTSVCLFSSTDRENWNQHLIVQQVQIVGDGTRVCLYSKCRQWKLEPGFVCTASADSGSWDQGLFVHQVPRQWEPGLFVHQEQTVGAGSGFVCTASTNSGSWSQGLFVQQVQTVGAGTRVCLFVQQVQTVGARTGGLFVQQVQTV